MSIWEELPPFSPLQCLALVADCPFVSEAVWKPSSSYALPSTAEFLDEESFAEVYAGWNEEKLFFFARVQSPFQGEGDSVELFLDTRDLKSKGVISRFCHHFVFYPAQVQGHFGREITRFRGEDTHRLCHPEDLIVHPSLASRSYSLSIEIPAACLTSYDPMTSPRLGFTYRIRRTEGPPQHWSASSDTYTLEMHPAVWGTLHLVRDKRKK